MWDKLKAVFSSIRFWQLLIAAVVIILADYGIIPVELANIVAGFFGISIAVRTLDKVGANLK